MHLLYALVRESSFSKAQGFIKPAPGQSAVYIICSGTGKGPQHVAMNRHPDSAKQTVQRPAERGTEFTHSPTDPVISFLLYNLCQFGMLVRWKLRVFYHSRRASEMTADARPTYYMKIFIRTKVQQINTQPTGSSCTQAFN